MGVVVVCDLFIQKGLGSPVSENSDTHIRVTQSTVGNGLGINSEWDLKGPDIWSITWISDDTGTSIPLVTSLFRAGEKATGGLRSHMFTIDLPIQTFLIAGADGTETSTNDGNKNYVLLRSYPDGTVLRRAHPPGTQSPVRTRWITSDLIGREVYIEGVDGNPQLNPLGYAWIAFGGYRQEDLHLTNPIASEDLCAVPIDASGEVVVCRSLPFQAAQPEHRGRSSRVISLENETIPIGAAAEAVYLLGMINEGFDNGLSWWSEHMELQATRDDQVFIGKDIGKVEIRYTNGMSDWIPLTTGVTAWFYSAWASTQLMAVPVPPLREPFSSRPDLMGILRKSLKLHEDPDIGGSPSERHIHYYLPIKPRPHCIDAIVIHDNDQLRGRPLVSGITLAGASPADGFKSFGFWKAEKEDLEGLIESSGNIGFADEARTLSQVLYNSETDLPASPAPVLIPQEIDASVIHFLGGSEAAWLTNTWAANLNAINTKFDRESGCHYESLRPSLWYGHWTSIGTWGQAHGGVYGEIAASRSCEYYATIDLRWIHDPERRTAFVDFCDKWLYFFRNNHDLDKGPPNDALDISRYPNDAPPHWSYLLNAPITHCVFNDIPGDEEMDGHASTLVARWTAWRMLGAPRDEWLTSKRSSIYGKSRWDSTRDGADFICWFMDHTGKDVIYSEGEGTGYGRGHNECIPEEMIGQTDPARIRHSYANCDMYEPYPTYSCLVALRCCAQIADVIGDSAHAERWRTYSERLRSGMIRLLRVGDYRNFMWRMGPFSVFPSFQESLVQAWFSIYIDGLDPQRWDPAMTQITRNTLRRQIQQPYGYAPVQAMGYGLGWLTTSALLLDEMDDAGPLLVNIGKYSYDKNMDYVDPSRGIDWRKWQWLICEGINLLPDGRWFRIGDLTNGAHLTALHALEIAAGIDDSDPGNLKILPRAPDPLTGIRVRNAFVLIPEAQGLEIARVDYTFRRSDSFSLKSDRMLPMLSVRVGPFDGEEEAHHLAESMVVPEGASKRVEKSGHFAGRPASWIWIEGLKQVTELTLRW